MKADDGQNITKIKMGILNTLLQPENSPTELNARKHTTDNIIQVNYLRRTVETKQKELYKLE